MATDTKRYSGNKGKVIKNGTPLARVLAWDVVEVTTAEAWVDSDTDGETEREPTNSDSTGNVTAAALRDAPAPIVDGEAFDVELIMNNVTGRKKTGCIIVENLNTTIAVREGSLAEYQFSFGQKGKLTTV